MDDISPEFNSNKPLGKKAKESLNPQIVELVKFLARVSSERDYNKLIQDQNKLEDSP